MVKTELIGGIGNNMFQYAIAYIYAYKKNYNLLATDLYKLQQYFPNVITVTDKITNPNNILELGYNSIEKTIQYIDTNLIEQHTGGLHFNGFFQKIKYYKDHIKILKKVFEYNDSYHKKPNNNDLVIHIRFGDYIQMNWFLHPEIFIKIIKKFKIKYDKCIIVTDEPNNPLLTLFIGLENVSIVNQTLLEDFTMLRCAKQIIISQSTFSWWATFLGNPEKVYVPLSTTYSNLPWQFYPKKDEIDLITNTVPFIKVPV